MIMFEDIYHKSKELSLPVYGDVLISTTTLEKLLLNADCEYVSEEAQFVDEKIFYFVTDDEIEMSDELLITLMMANL